MHSHRAHRQAAIPPAASRAVPALPAQQAGACTALPCSSQPTQDAALVADAGLSSELLPIDVQEAAVGEGDKVDLQAGLAQTNWQTHCLQVALHVEAEAVGVGKVLARAAQLAGLDRRARRRSPTGRPVTGAAFRHLARTIRFLETKRWR